MKRKILMLSIFLIATAIGLILYQGLSVAEESSVPDDIIYTKPVKAVVFSHKVHTGLGMDCMVCHDKLFQMSAKDVESKPDFNMKGLYAGKYCGSCHARNGMAFASDTQCARCHIGAKGLSKAEKSEK